MTAMEDRPTQITDKQKIIIHEINKVLGNDYVQTYKRIIAKELEQTPLNNEELKKACNKVKNLVALFIDKTKAELIAQKIKPYLDSPT